MQGGPGETVRAPFLVANEYDRPLDITFEASALRGEGDAEIPVERIAFEPPSLTLARGQRVVQAAITIPGSATPGTTYCGEVRVKGYQARTIALAVSVGEPAVPPADDRKRRGGTRADARSRRKATKSKRPRGGAPQA